MSTQTRNGKAFEYACLEALSKVLSTYQEVQIESTPQLKKANRFFLELIPENQEAFDRAARAAARVIVRLEPQLEYPEGKGILYLSIQSDDYGRDGDVRDVLCVRKTNGWEIGLSCKQNHHAVKHSRLSAKIDFGKEWFGIPCSLDYFDSITPLFNSLRDIRASSSRQALWGNIENKVLLA